MTGGSRGVGASTVLHLAKRGVNCVLTYRQDSTAAERVVAAARIEGAQAVAIRLDTRDTELLDAFVPTVRQALGDVGAARFDYLVNSASVAHRGTIDSTTGEALDFLYEAHFKGVFLLTQKLLPLIQDGGRIVNVTTALARSPEPGSAGYASMKGAIEVFTRHLAMELAARGIAVDAIVSCGTTADARDIGPAIASLLSPG